MQYYLGSNKITEQQALDMEAAGKAHVSYGSSGGNTPDGSGEPWIRLAHGPAPEPGPEIAVPSID